MVAFMVVLKTTPKYIIFYSFLFQIKGVAHDVRGFGASFVNEVCFRCITSGSH